MSEAFQTEGYDKGIRQTLPYYEDFYKQVTDILKVSGRNPISWLDIGCGTGKMYAEAKKELSISSFVFTDISEEMLEISRNRFQRKGNHFQKMAAQEVSDIDRYDVITAIQVNHYMTQEERGEAVKRCYRALKPGGYFFSFENIAPTTEAGRELFLHRWQRFQVQNGKSIDEAVRHGKRYGKDYFPITISAHLALLEECGFHTAELIWMSYMQAGFWGMK